MSLILPSRWGVAGCFAAEGKKAGDLSHYGVQLECALRSLFQCGGEWNRFHYQSVFCQTFDRGGHFVSRVSAESIQPHQDE